MLCVIALASIALPVDVAHASQGGAIYFVDFGTEEEPAERLRIARASGDDPSEVRVLPLRGSVSNPQPSPTGGRLLYLRLSEVGSRSRVFVANQRGAKGRPVADDRFEEYCPSWQRDGREFVELFVDPATSTSGLRVVSLNGSTKAVDLYGTPGSVECAAYLGDGFVFQFRVDGSSRTELWWVDSESRMAPLAVLEGCDLGVPSVSRSDQFIAAPATCTDPASDGLWVFDLRSDRAARVFTGSVAFAAWGPDDDSLVIAWDPGGSDLGMRVQQISRSGEIGPVVAGPVSSYPAWGMNG